MCYSKVCLLQILKTHKIEQIFQVFRLWKGIFFVFIGSWSSLFSQLKLGAAI